MRVGVALGADNGCLALVVDAQEMGWEAERIPFTAAPGSPSVAFLKPTGVDRPLDISRWVWDSEVRAPMAVQVMRSPIYCGGMGSRASVAAGKPSSAMLSRNPRALRTPFSMWKESSMRGSLMNPFQPMAVRGFSK